MGGGPAKEHMVIALWSPEPSERTAAIKARFPYIDITYLHLGDPRKDGAPTQQDIPAEIYATATIWVTLGVLPPTPESVPKLQLIHLFSAGVDHFAAHPLLTESGVAITTSSGISAPPIAEWVLLTTLALTKRFPAAWARQTRHEWARDANDGRLREGRDWVGKRVGILGYGSIGRQVARLLAALGARVLAYTAGPRDTAEARRDGGYIVPGTGDAEGAVPEAWYSGTGREELHRFLGQRLDLLVISLPLTKATERLLGREEFAILGDACTTPGGPYVANISRGRIIDQPALVEALKAGTLAGAMLDVAEPEPLPEGDPLWEAPNVVITPHISSLGVEYVGRAYDVLVENLARRERGEKLVNLVNRRKGY